MHLRMGRKFSRGWHRYAVWGGGGCGGKPREGKFVYTGGNMTTPGWEKCNCCTADLVIQVREGDSGVLFS